MGQSVASCRFRQVGAARLALFAQNRSRTSRVIAGFAVQSFWNRAIAKVVEARQAS